MARLTGQPQEALSAQVQRDAVAQAQQRSGAQPYGNLAATLTHAREAHVLGTAGGEDAPDAYATRIAQIQAQELAMRANFGEVLEQLSSLSEMVAHRTGFTITDNAYFKALPQKIAHIREAIEGVSETWQAAAARASAPDAHGDSNAQANRPPGAPADWALWEGRAQALHTATNGMATLAGSDSVQRFFRRAHAAVADQAFRERLAVVAIKVSIMAATMVAGGAGALAGRLLGTVVANTIGLTEGGAAAVLLTGVTTFVAEESAAAAVQTGLTSLMAAPGPGQRSVHQPSFAANLFDNLITGGVTRLGARWLNARYAVYANEHRALMANHAAWAQRTHAPDYASSAVLAVVARHDAARATADLMRVIAPTTVTALATQIAYQKLRHHSQAQGELPPELRDLLIEQAFGLALGRSLGVFVRLWHNRRIALRAKRSDAPAPQAVAHLIASGDAVAASARQLEADPSLTNLETALAHADDYVAAARQVADADTASGSPAHPSALEPSTATVASGRPGQHGRHGQHGAARPANAQSHTGDATASAPTAHGTPALPPLPPTKLSAKQSQQVAAHIGNGAMVDKDGAFAVPRMAFDALHAEWAQRHGAPPTTIHYDDRANGVHFDAQVSLAGKLVSVRVYSNLGRRITAFADINDGKNFIVGHPVSLATATKILRATAQGKLNSLSEVGLAGPPVVAVDNAVEWGIGMTSRGAVIVRGDHFEIDWSGLPGVVPLAHSHPSTADNNLHSADRGRDGELLLTKLLTPTPLPLLDRAMIFPSGMDIISMAQKKIEGHRVITPFTIDGEVVRKGNQNESRLEFVIVAPTVKGFDDNGARVYSAKLEASCGARQFHIDVWVVESPTIPSSHWTPSLTPPSSIQSKKL